jgi:HSP20 family molecular chaperone IbpA
MWVDDLVNRSPNSWEDFKQKEVDGKLVLNFDVPGCGPEDVEVVIGSESRGILYVTSKGYCQEIRIPSPYYVKDCTATVKNGVLILKIGKFNLEKIPVTGV